MGSARHRPPAEEDVPGPPRQLSPGGAGPAAVDRPGVESGVAPEDRLLRSGRGGQVAGRDPDDAADAGEDDCRDGAGGRDRDAAVASPVYLGGPGGDAHTSTEYAVLSTE